MLPAQINIDRRACSPDQAQAKHADAIANLEISGLLLAVIHGGDMNWWYPI